MTDDFGTEPLLLRNKQLAYYINSYKNSTLLHSVEGTITNFHTYLFMNADSKALSISIQTKDNIIFTPIISRYQA